MNQSITSCEIAFKKCFSKWAETDQLIRFSDPELPDMYDHNMTLIKTHGMTTIDIETCILAEFKNASENGAAFSKCICDKFIDESSLGTLPGEPSITHYGFYLLDCSRVEEWKENVECKTRIAASHQDIEDLLTLELANYGEERGEDFCTRRVNRIGEIFLSPGRIDACLIYHDEELAGKCDLFLHKSTAKIEDFDVKTDLRKQYIGTTLLKSVVKDALNRGADEIYLVTDEDDTVKDMYRNLGFERVDVWTEFFWGTI
jgi:spore maturation protein CgeE